MIVWDWLALITGILLIIIVLMQRSNDNIQDAFSGEKSELMKDKTGNSFERMMTTITTSLTVLFILFVILSNVVERL